MTDQRQDDVINIVVADVFRRQNDDVLLLELIGAGRLGDEIADARFESVLGDLRGHRRVPNHTLIGVDVHQSRRPRNPVQRPAIIVFRGVFDQPAQETSAEKIVGVLLSGKGSGVV